ncbi:MAG: BrnT family toxin [Herpetosiphonaceae bacterium]|nr:BrnT family toxin [Herpetosiphonaceae bacterium]
MRIESIIWLEVIVEKLAVKHHVEPEEVEEALYNARKFRFIASGDRTGEDVYMALGQTDAGRYLTVLFIYKLAKEALILSARDMATKERNWYGRK